MTFVLIWSSLLYFSGIELRINWEALKKIPEAVALYSVSHVVFTTWAWRFPFFQDWLVPYPDLQGTWEGTLESTWVNPQTGRRLGPVRVVLVIRQSFSSISCAMYSQESSSHSSAAQISADEESGVLSISYTYTNKPKAVVRDRSEIHDGAAMLRIIGAPPRTLEGEYWTGRKTTGDVRLAFKSRELASKFS